MIALIPAKRNSKRLPNKNIKNINGKPLILYTINAALKSKKISRVIVSTDCENIAKMVSNFGAEVPFLRPKKLCGTKTSLIDVCGHALNYFKKKENINPSGIVALQPTSPLRNDNDINKCINLFKKKNADLVASFYETKPKQWHKELSDDGRFKNFISGNNYVYQTAKKNYLLNGAIYIFNSSFFNKKKKNNYFYGYVMPKKRSIDIDDLYDFELAERELKKNE